MSPSACITLDLESDHASHATKRYEGLTEDKIEPLLKILDKNRAPLTVFVVGEILNKIPAAIRLFQKYGAEFHLHSFSHNTKFPDSESEIKKGIEAYHKFFGKNPRGYRAPEGRISKKGLKRLADYDFGFDASVFPAFWPNPSYLLFPSRPFLVSEERIWEIPFSVVFPLRIPLTLSYMKLIGWKVYKKILERYQLPNPVVFGCHLHDFWRLPGYNELSFFWKLVYTRNSNKGLYILDQFLSLLRENNYNFVTMGELFKLFHKNQ